jgi:D-glycero-alpha-D-manno-heptose-7-phosphate kinase
MKEQRKAEETKMIVKTQAASRIDLAGGTLDLYPLYLFMGGGVTVNAGLNLYSHVEIETREDEHITIVSEDLDKKVKYESIDKMTLEGPTAFIESAIRSYAPGVGLNVKTRNTAPRGSGLGASSSLLMALSAALLKVRGEDIDMVAMIDRGAAIEAGHLGVPTGKQDYYAAVLGGIHALHFDEKGCNPEEIPAPTIFRQELQESLIVSFTGISHFSGTNNWEMLKKAIDRVGSTYDGLLEIKKITGLTRTALLEKDLEKLGNCINMEWESRKLLAPGITNRFINEAIEGAKQAGAWGSKLCGAGGGGCMITLTPPDKRDEAVKALVNAGVEILSANLDFKGLIVKVED